MPLVTGIYVHEGLASLLKGENVNEVVAALVAKYELDVAARGVYGVEDNVESFLAEQKALLAGLLAGWAICRLPALHGDYEVLTVEQEVEWDIAPGIRQMLRTDALLRRKSDQLLFILEFKTLASPGYAWQNQWEHNIQILSYTLAVEETRGEPVGGVMIEGLVKGIRKRETAQRSPFFGQTIQNSPFCYAYAHPMGAGLEPLLQWDYSPKATKVALDWQRVLAEVRTIPSLTEQFISMPPIAPVREQQLRWRRQTIAAEVRWAMALKEIRKAEEATTIYVHDAARKEYLELLDFHAPQHDNHCLRYGSPCAFTDVCFNSEVEADPIGSGLYQERTPHHETELVHATGS